MHKVSARTKVAYQPKSLKTGGCDRYSPTPCITVDYEYDRRTERRVLKLIVYSIYLYSTYRYHDDATSYRYIYEVDTSGMKPCPTSILSAGEGGGRDKEREGTSYPERQNDK